MLDSFITHEAIDRLQVHTHNTNILQENGEKSKGQRRLQLHNATQ